MKSRLEINVYQKQFYGLLILAVLFLILKLGVYFFIPNENQIPTISFVGSSSSTPAEILTEFDPNELDKEQWKKLGFSEKQVATILKYKEIVGGLFTSKEQLKKCYVISEDKFSKLAPLILLPENASEQKKYLKNWQTDKNKDLKILGKFNPNEYSLQNWMNMGFSENQANAILKYKKYLGGSFISKEKLKQCFIISDKNYQKMEPFLLLPEKSPLENIKPNNTPFSNKKNLNLQPFDPNLYSTEDWKAIGFSEKQAQVIVNYRDINLKGSFRTKQDIQNCFVISADKYAEISPFIVINPENTQSKTLPKTEYKKPEEPTNFSKIDLNQINFKQLREFGFDEKSAASILGFRKSLGGFVNKSQVLETYGIPEELAKQLISTVQFTTPNITKYSLQDAPENWLKTHPYFKYNADKIIYKRISEKNDRKIWKFINVNPEQEIKMKWYLR